MPLDYTEFAKKIKNKYPEYNDVDDLTLSKKMVEKYPEYKNEVSFESTVKKKEVSQSTPKQELTSSVTSKTAQKQPSVSSVNKNNALPGEYLYYEGKGTRRYDDGKWYDYSYSEDRNGKQVDIYDKQITDPTRVNTLNKHFGKVGSTSANEDVFTGYPGQEKNQYRVIEDKWQKKMPGQEKWRIVTNEGSIQSLNKEFKKNVSVPSNLEELKKQQEEDIIKDKKLNSSLTWVNSGLIGSEEDEASEILKKKFPGFDFIKQGALTDELLVVAPNGARANISLDNWTDEDDRKQSTVLREFIKNNSDEKLVKSANDLRLKESQERTFIEDQKKQSLEAGVVAQDWKWDNGKLIIETPLDKAKKSQEYQDIKSGLKESRKEYMSSKAQQFDDIYYRFKDQPKNNEEMIAAYASVKADDQEIKRVNDYVNDIKNNSNDFKKEKSNIESYTNSAILKLQSGEITQEEFDSEYKPEIEKRVSDLNEKSKSLSNELKTIGTVDNSINQSVAKNYLIKEATGSFVGGVASKFINGFTYLPRLASMGDMSKKDQEDIVNLITGGGTTKEYMESGERSDVSKALFSMSESLGILASSAILGGTTAYPSFYAQSYYEMKDELDSIPQMSETEKVIMSGAYGVISSALEKFGIDAVTQKTKIGKNLTNNIIKGIFTDLPKNASKEFIDAAISNNIKKYVVKSGLQAAIGAGSEGITESLQNLTSVGVKELYDLAKGTEYFNNKSAWNILGDTVYEGWLGALGGGVMSTVTSSADVIKNGVSSTLNKEQINTLINSASVEGIDSALLTNLKSSILTGKITSDEAKDINDSFHLIKSKLNSLPDNMSTDDKSVSLDLLIERDKLQKESSRLDEALRAPYNNRIAEINNKLLNISENAVKESTKPVEEVTAEGGGVQYQGVEEGQPEIREGEGPVGETAQPETDLGNRPIEGRGVQEEVVVEAKPTKEEIQRDNVVRIQQEYNALTDRGKKGKQGNELKQRILSLASTLNYTVNENKGKISLVNEQGKKVVRTAFKEEIAEQPEYEIEVAKAAINSGLLAWDGDPLTMRWDSPLSWTDIRKGQKDISEGKYTTQPAKRLIIELNNQYKSGDFGMMQGSGKFINRTGIPVNQAFAEEALLPIPPEAEQEILEQRAAEEEQFVASEMIQEKTNLGKVYDYLDKLDKILDETLAPDKLNDITRVLPAAVMKVVVKALKVSVQAGMTLEQAIKDYAQKNNIGEKQITDSLYNMTDYQNKKTRERVTGEKQPKVKISKEAKEAKDISKRKVTKVVIKDEYKAMITQIKLEVKAAREAKLDLNAKRKMLASAISGMVKTGKIKATQAATLIKRISNLNLDNPVMVERFVNYAERVFERADYQETLSKAFETRKSIRKLLKTDNQAEVVGMAKEFTKIDPSMVEDIDAYIAMAEKVKNAVKPSVAKIPDPILKQAANIAEISEYSKNEIDRQEQIKIDELLATYDYLEDISEGMSFKELQDIVNLLKEKEDANPDKQDKVMEFLKARMDTMAGILEPMLKDGIDPMTGEEITFDDKQKDLMKRAIKIDLNEISIREAIKIVESIDNFLTNQITSGLEAAVSSYEGAMNDKQLVQKGFKAKSLKFLKSGKIGRGYTEQLFSLPLMIEKMFGGINRSVEVMNKWGLSKLINGVNKANKQFSTIVDSYTKQSFYSTKNSLGVYVMNKGFMDAENVYERGMLSFLKRNLIGTPTEMKAEFERRVRMIKESIDVLIQDGNSKERKMGELYKEVYNKLNIDSMDMDVIDSNASKNNLEAINWWINQWSKHYSDLSDISLSVYNTQLGSDLNYTPDKYKRLSSKEEEFDKAAVERNGSFAISIDYTDKNKSGVLIESTRPNTLPNSRYVSLDFDTNNAKALKSALTDINTASAIRQIDGFMSSNSFKQLIPDSDDRKIITRRINTYIRRAKGKNIVPSDTMQDVERFGNFITALGVGKALGGVSQAVTQTVPVMLNTVVNAGRFDIADAKFNAWLDDLGVSTSNRGLESQATVESIDRQLEATNGNTQKIIKGVEELSQFYLKQFLSRPDIFVARSSFKSYYLQNLKRRGISTDIDWTTHEPDMEAVEYAEAMVSRQQNVSDPLLAGEFLASDEPMRKISRKAAFPFASFILNQKARMYNDLSTIASSTATKEDKISAGRSLAGLGVELAAFQLIGFGIRRLYDLIAASILGDEDDEEAKKKKMLNATKYPVKSIVNDIVSPFPGMTDKYVTWGLNEALSFYPWMDDKEVKDAVKERNKILELKGEDPMDAKTEAEFIKNIKDEATYQVFEDDDRSGGMYGIALNTYNELFDVSELATTGEFTDEYQGRETTKKLLESDREKVKYAVPFMIAYSTGLLPKDVGTISKNYINRIKKKAVTEKQYERYDNVQKELGRNLKSWEIDIVKNKKETETAVDEIKFIENNGGLTERQGREYLKLMKAIGEPSVSDIVKIKNGQTADQLLK
jgi:hypothetical protein